MKDRIKAFGIWAGVSFGAIVGWVVGQGILYYARNTGARVTIDDLVQCWVSAPLIGAFIALVLILRFIK